MRLESRGGICFLFLRSHVPAQADLELLVLLPYFWLLGLQCQATMQDWILTFQLKLSDIRDLLPFYLIPSISIASFFPLPIRRNVEIKTGKEWPGNSVQKHGHMDKMGQTNHSGRTDFENELKVPEGGTGTPATPASRASHLTIRR